MIPVPVVGAGLLAALGGLMAFVAMFISAAPTPPPLPTPPTFQSPPPAPAPPAPPRLIEPADVDARFVGAVNATRADAGLAPLGWSDDLAAYAERHLADMLTNPADDHAGLWHSDLFRLVDPDTGWGEAGENLGRGATPGAIYQALLDSPTHRANIVDPVFTHAAAASAVADDGTLVTVHIFGRPDA